jgi:O-antigen/teichoic acid export membrane protein
LNVKNLFQTVLPRGGLRRDMTTLVGATAIGAGVYFLILPLLTRLYTPEAFGELVVYVALVSVILVVSSWRYEAAIPIASSPDEARALSALSFGLVGATALTAGALAAVLAGFGIFSVSIPLFGLVLGAGILFGGIVQVIVATELRASRYGAIASMRIAQPTSTGLGQLALSELTRSGIGLVGGDLFVLGIAAATLIAARPSVVTESVHTRWASIKAVADRFRRFPQYSAPASLLNAAGLHLPVVVIGALFGLSTAGLLGVTQRILGVAAILVGRSLSQVYVGRASEHIRAANFSALLELFRQMTRWMAVIFGLPFLLVALFAPILAEYLLGPEWRDAGEFARLLAPAFFAQILVVPMSSTLNLLERQPWQLGWDAFRLFAVMALIVITYILGFAATGVVAALSVAQVVSYGLLYALILRAIGDAKKASTIPS